MNYATGIAIAAILVCALLVYLWVRLLQRIIPGLSTIAAVPLAIGIEVLFLFVAPEVKMFWMLNVGCLGGLWLHARSKKE